MPPPKAPQLRQGNGVPFDADGVPEDRSCGKAMECSQLSDTESSQLSDSESSTDSCVPDVPATPEQTAVAAKKNPSGRATRLRQWAPPGMEIHKVRHAHSLREGVSDKPATGSEPPAGPIALPDRMPDGKWVNLNTWVITHVVASHEVDAVAFLKRIAQTTSHITVVSLLPQKNGGSSSRMKHVLLRAAGLSCLPKLVHGHEKLVQTAVAAKLVVELFTDTFCIVHRCIVDTMSCEEWDCGPMESRFGSLHFTMQRERGQRDRIMTLDVVNIPDKLPDNDPFSDDMHKQLAKWICSDNVCVLTGTFGKGNEVGIAMTAVAAGASIGHRICTRFKRPGRSTHARMSGGFLVFAPYNRLFESPTELTAGQCADLGEDIIAELQETPDAQIDGRWSIGSGTEACPNLWDIKLKPICWKHHVFGMVQTRLYVGSSRQGKRNRQFRCGHPREDGSPASSCTQGQQLLEHTPAWKNMIQAKKDEIPDFRAAQQWEQAIDASVPETAVAALVKREKREHEPETAVAALVKRQKVEHHPQTAVAARVKCHWFEVQLVPRQPSCQPPPHLLEGGHDGHSDPDAADDPARGREADESDESDEAKGQKGKGKKGKSKGKKGCGKGKKGNGKGYKGKKGNKDKGNACKGKGYKSKGQKGGKDRSCGEMNPLSLSPPRHDSESDEDDRKRRYRPSPSFSRHAPDPWGLFS